MYSENLYMKLQRSCNYCLDFQQHDIMLLNVVFIPID